MAQLDEIIEIDEKLIDPAPFQLVRRTSVYKVHSLFSLVSGWKWAASGMRWEGNKIMMGILDGFSAFICSINILAILSWIRVDGKGTTFITYQYYIFTYLVCNLFF